MRYLIIAVMLMLLGGCATTAKFETLLNSWVGSTEDQLVRRWGPPSSTYETGGTKYLTYVQSSSGYVPGVAPSYQTQVIGNTAYTRPTGGMPGYGYTDRCTVNFAVQNGQIVSWRYEGNMCRSK